MPFNFENDSKLSALAKYLKNRQKVAVAFSGGVDSAFLLKFASQILGKNAMALNVSSVLQTKTELAEVQNFCRQHQIALQTVQFDPLQIPGFCLNPANRCYLCKKAIFTRIKQQAQALGFCCVIDGSNADDAGDFRPGMQALKELEIESPMKMLGITKAEVRQFAKNLNLEQWNKAASACLASRINYGEEITSKKLYIIEESEQFLRSLGVGQCRVRMHQNIARIEVLQEQMPLIFENKALIDQTLKNLGFSFVTLDLFGFKSGSLNKNLLQN